MKSQITDLEPKLVWKHFKDLTDIPRPSKSEGKAVDFIYNFGKILGYETIKDGVGNIVIKKPATKGMENKKVTVLQGHLDMVPQKNADKEHNFEKDPIEAYVDGEWVTANGTTLGADNGIGVAAAMAVLDSEDIEHGPIEALFTVDEETGLTGASALKPGMLNSEILLNLDSEDDEELFIGCAGGINANINISYTKDKVPDNHIPYRVSVKNLKGGHSGLDIHKGRGNSIIILIRLLWRATFKCQVKLSNIKGGSLRNAIPREAFADILVPKSKCDEFIKFISGYENILKAEYALIDPDMSITAEKIDPPEFIINEEIHKKLISAIYTCPNGVIRMSSDMENLVETSSNLAIVKTEDKHIHIQALIRSSMDSAKDDLVNRFLSLFDLAGAKVEFEGEYPGWKPNLNSEILEVAKKVYRKKNGVFPEVKAIHAGLECGIIGGIYPGMDMVSFGPTIRNAHSPDEKVNIESVNKFWTYLVDILKNIPDKDS
jgi:dipeptidase D